MFPYIGGKAHHVGWLDPLFPNIFNKFVDVFGGAGWVSVKSDVAQRAQQNVYNDYNPHLANIFRHFSVDPDAVKQQINCWPQQDAVLYRQFQQDIFGDNKPIMNLETAAKYLYLEVQSFSGNTLGLTSSVYFDKIHTINPLLKKLGNHKITTRLKKLTVENLDCIEVIKKYDSPDTFFYVDPPYYKMEFYYSKDFPREKHQELCNVLTNIKGKFALSYYDFNELKDYYPEDKFYWHRQSVYRSSATRSSNDKEYSEKSKGTEILIMNYKKEHLKHEFF